MTTTFNIDEEIEIELDSEFVKEVKKKDEEINNKIVDKVIEKILPQIPIPENGKDGKNGEAPTKKELKEIIKPLVPDEKEIIKKVISKIPKPKDGEKGDKGEDGKTLKFSDLTPYEKQVLTGPQGSNGVGVPRGGTTGQKLVKSSSKDFDTEWTNDSGGGTWGSITGTLSDQTDLQTALNGKQPVGTYVTGATNSTLTLTGTTLGLNLSNANTWTATQTGSQATTSSTLDAWIASTSATATSGNQKASTAFKWTASGWKTDSTAGARQVDFRAFVLPEQGATLPSGILKFQSQVNNGGYTDQFWLDSKVGGLGAYFNTSGSNNSPGTTRAITINNTGSTSWIDWTFSGVRKVADGANSSGGRDFYASGGNYFSYINGNSSTLFSYNYPTAFVHYGQGIFGDKVGAGSNATPSSTLASAGSIALGKGKRVTNNYTLTSDDATIYADSSTAACSGTPTYNCDHWSNQTDCEKWDAHGGCSWFAGYSCSDWNGNQDECNGHSGCTYDTSSCSGFGDESTCNSYSGCSWGNNPQSCVGLDESTCGMTSGCTVNTGYCTNNYSNCVWDSGGGTCGGGAGCDAYTDQSSCESATYWSSCSGGGSCSSQSDESSCSAYTYYDGCTGTYDYYSCTGDYYTGNCSGVYGAACQGTSTCAGIDDSTNCGFETGCTWSTAITLNLPQVTTCLHRDYWIYNDSSSSADVIVTPYSGDQIDKTTSYTLGTYKDSIHIKAFYETTSCDSFNEGACTPAGCSKVYYNCSWDSGMGTCSGNAVCTGIGDQSTCESTTYFSYCSGSYYSIKNWYLLSRS